MKKLILLCLMSFVWTTEFYSQEYIEPEWKFHLAFEDGTGARDTLWIVLDSQIDPGSFGVNSEYGEVPYSLNDTIFNVYTGLNWMTVTKLRAFNINHPWDVEIQASNYLYPIIVSWDTTLFNAPVLQSSSAGSICNPRMDNDWFFFQTNAPWLHHMYSMNYSDHVVLPSFDWGSQDHFPFWVYTDRSHACNPLSVESFTLAETLHLSPNPCNELLQLRSDAQLQDVAVYNLQGKKVLQQGFAGGIKDMRIDVAALPPGMYLLHARDGQGRVGVKKFVKGD